MGPSSGPDLDLYPRLTRRGLERLTALAEDLRDYALLEAGRLEIEKSEFPLEEAVAAALVELAEELREKRIAFQGPEPAPGGPIRADRGRITRALSRLLAAAVRSCAECGWM